MKARTQTRSQESGARSSRPIPLVPELTHAEKTDHAMMLANAWLFAAESFHARRQFGWAEQCLGRAFDEIGEAEQLMKGEVQP